MATTYVIETFRILGQAGNLKVFQGCWAKVSGTPVDGAAKEKFYAPEAWRELLGGSDVMYRHKSESEFYRPI